MATTIHLPGYEVVKLLYASTRTLVYQGIRQHDQCAVVIKVARNPFPSVSELVQFHNQYTIMLRIAEANAKNLDFPQVVKPLALEPYQNGYALVMEDFQGISLRELLVQEGPWGTSPDRLAAFLQIALQLTTAVANLHQHQIIHKDIKPANILINPQTQQVKLTDFSLASLLPHETQDIQPATALEGTLAYLSPEQTGRMNRGIDYRSDFYALGVTFYQLISGQFPFATDDPMELIHCHLAQMPVPLHHRNPQVPIVLSELVGKLMAKNAEDRYQSAFGLHHDLQCCWIQWQVHQRVEPFALGERDSSDRFLIPEKLYGREAEVQTLLAACDRVGNPSPDQPRHRELMLVAGPSGVGKTVVVNEIHKPIVKQHGYFIKGKFDQLNRTVPFSALVQALRDLMRQLLQESDAQLQDWKAKILVALGESGQVILEVIPELAQIIGEQPAAIELAGMAAQHRFHSLFQKFIQVFASADHPLVIFLDDLQWADAATLNLMQVLMTDLDMGYLLLIGAYRDHEVSSAHPLLLTIAAIAQAGATVHTLTLGPLSMDSLNQLVADTLHCSADLAHPLTNLVYQKTQGNPFFAAQFLKALHQDGLVEFDRQAGYWQCDLARVQAAALTDDVVELMAARLQKLPDATQTLLKLAACIGNQFDLATLAIVAEQSIHQTAALLWKALQEGLVLPITETYKFFQAPVAQTRIRPDDQIRNELPTIALSIPYRFLHDRVQQAAYSLIPDGQKSALHLKIGQLLQPHLSTNSPPDFLFDTVTHFNHGRTLITDPDQRLELAHLNLRVAQKAKLATAYGLAVEYADIGLQLLGAGGWETEYALTLALSNVHAEASFLNGQFGEMTDRLQTILQRAETLLDRIKAYEVKIHALIAQNQMAEAVSTGLQVLKKLGVDLPDLLSEQAVSQGLASIQTLLATMTIADLANLPLMDDPEKVAAMNILLSIAAAAYICLPLLYPLIVFQLVRLSIVHGNTGASIHGYAAYGLILCGVVGEPARGFEFGQLATHLLNHLHAKELTAKTWLIVAGFVNHWNHPLPQTLPFLLQGYTQGREMGDPEFAAYCAFLYSCYGYFAGKELALVHQEFETYHTAIAHLRQQATLNWQTVIWQTVRRFMGSSLDSLGVVDVEQAKAEQATIAALSQGNDDRLTFYFHFGQLTFNYHLENYPQATHHAILAQEKVDGAVGLYFSPLFYFYDALLNLALCAEANPQEQDQRLAQVTATQAKLELWATHAPMTHQHKWHLVEAERCRLLDRRAEALEHYDLAIAGAKENGYLQEAALANELAAKFYLAWGKEKVAAGYLQEAYYDYARWGAQAKLDDLERRYPHLLAPILQAQSQRAAIDATDRSMHDRVALHKISNVSRSQSTHTSDSLDVWAILKASQALSREIQLEQLVATLLRVIMGDAGAKQAAFLIPRNDPLDKDTLDIAAMAMLADDGTIRYFVPLFVSEALPLTLVNYVKHSLETIVLDDATTQANFAADPYLMQHQPRSVLCTPILHQGKLLGLLYLENSLTVGAFTWERLEIICLLCIQAAISLENARLYTNLQTDIRNRQQTEQQIQQQWQFLHTVLDTVPNLIFVKDWEGRYLLANKALAAFYGLTVDELMGKTIAEVHNNSREVEQFLQQNRTVIQSGQPLFIPEEQVRNAQGSEEWLQWQKRPLRVPGIEMPCVLGVGVNITARKQTEVAIQKRLQQEQALSRLFQAIRNSLDLETIFATATAETSQLLTGLDCFVVQYLPTEGIWKYVAEFRADPTLSSLIGLEISDLGYPFSEPLKQQQLVCIEAPIHQETAPMLPGAWLLIPLQVEGQLWGGFVLGCAQTPFTWTEDQVALAETVAGQLEVAIQQAELYQQVEQERQNLRHSEAELRAVFAAMTDVVVVRNAQGQCLKVAPTNALNFYRLPTELLGKTLFETFPHQQAELLLNSLQTALTTGQTTEVDYSLEIAGTMVWFAASISPMTEDRVVIVARDISDRKRIEEALAANERRLRTIIEAEPECVKILAEDGTILEMNPAGLAMLEADSPQQVIGQKAVSCILPRHRKAFVELGKRIFRGETGQLEFVIVGLKGAQRWVDSHAVPLRNDQNEIVGILAITRDISDRKAAELALQQLNRDLERRVQQRTADLQASEARFRSFFDIAPIGIAVADVQTYRFTAVNQAFCDLLGYSKTELLTLASCLSISVEEDWEAERPYTEALLKGELNCYQLEKRYLKKNGDIIIGSLTVTVLRNQTGQTTLLLGMVQDITQRKQAENQLRRSDTHLKLAQRIAKLGSWEFDIQAEQITWSEEVFRIFGLDPMAGPPATFEALQQCFHPDDRALHAKTIRRTIVTGQPYDTEFRIHQPTATLVYIQVKGEAVLNSAGQTIQLIGTVLDISDRKRAEQKIRQTAIQLVETNQELESFSYSVSHDLRAPLRHINGFVNALQQRLQGHTALSDPKVVHYLQVIESSSQKMALLIDGLLTLSRTGRKSMTYQSVALRNLVTEAIALAQSNPDLNQPVEFIIGDLPIVHGDPTLLQQVLSNLISNAVKFSQHQPQPRVEIGSLPEGTLFIRDNGVGFNMQYADKLFGAFQRLHTQADFEGTGIGLAIVQRIIHRHHGRIWAESQPNQGATFYFTLGDTPALSG